MEKLKTKMKFETTYENNFNSNLQRIKFITKFQFNDGKGLSICTKYGGNNLGYKKNEVFFLTFTCLKFVRNKFFDNKILTKIFQFRILQFGMIERIAIEIGNGNGTHRVIKFYQIPQQISLTNDMLDMELGLLNEQCFI